MDWKHWKKLVAGFVFVLFLAQIAQAEEGETNAFVSGAEVVEGTVAGAASVPFKVGGDQVGHAFENVLGLLRAAFDIVIDLLGVIDVGREIYADIRGKPAPEPWFPPLLPPDEAGASSGGG